MDRLGIESISVFGMPPVRFVALAADLDCQYISLGLTPLPDNPLGYPGWSLRDDPALRRELKAAMRDRGVSIALAEGFFLMPGVDVCGFTADLDLLAGLGVTRINTVGIGPDFDHTVDQLAALVEMAENIGMETMLEFIPGLPIGDLDAAVAAIRRVGRRSFRLLIDTMHVARSGCGAADIAALDPAIIGYAQLCDVPLIAPHGDYGREAKYERLVPGEGEVALLDMLRALPREVVVGLEVPMLAEAQAGIDAHQRLGRCVRAARNLLKRVNHR